MGRIAASHVAGLDLIDKLFFNQVLVFCLFEEELVWLKELAADLDRELTGKGITGVHRQVLKHCVLCMMEIELSDSLLRLREAYPDKLPALPEAMSEEGFQETERYTLEFFQGMVLAAASLSHQSDTQLVIEITNALLEKYREAPATVRFRLVDRMFAFEFMPAPIDCFTWLAKMGVLDSSKHPGVGLKSRYQPEFLQRLALMCEFDLHRDHNWRTARLDVLASSGLHVIAKETPQESRDLLLQQEIKRMEVLSKPELNHRIPGVDLGELENPASIQRFFTHLNTYALRFRFFQGSLASWTGMMCGGGVEILHRLQDRKRPIYADEFNEGSLTQLISEGMSARGFEITARTIYERHRDFKETVLAMITTYYQLLLFQGVAPPPNIIDMTHHGLALRFDRFKPKLRRPPRQRA